MASQYLTAQTRLDQQLTYTKINVWFWFKYGLWPLNTNRLAINGSSVWHGPNNICWNGRSAVYIYFMTKPGLVNTFYHSCLLSHRIEYLNVAMPTVSPTVSCWAKNYLHFGLDNLLCTPPPKKKSGGGGQNMVVYVCFNHMCQNQFWRNQIKLVGNFHMCFIMLHETEHTHNVRCDLQGQYQYYFCLFHAGYAFWYS